APIRSRWIPRPEPRRATAGGPGATGADEPGRIQGRRERPAPPLPGFRSELGRAGPATSTVWYGATDRGARSIPAIAPPPERWRRGRFPRRGGGATQWHTRQARARQGRGTAAARSTRRRWPSTPRASSVTVPPRRTAAWRCTI